jgi:hypothetical protein
MGKCLIDACYGKRLSHWRGDVSWKVVMGNDPRSDEDLLVNCEVPNEIIGSLIGSCPIVNFVKTESFTFAKTIAAFYLKVAISKLKDEILTKIPPWNHILNFALQFSEQDLIRLYRL